MIVSVIDVRVCVCTHVCVCVCVCSIYLGIYIATVLLIACSICTCDKSAEYQGYCISWSSFYTPVPLQTRQHNLETLQTIKA